MQEMLQCLNHPQSEPSVLERQRARLQRQQAESYSSIENFLSLPTSFYQSPHSCAGLGDDGWPDLSATTHYSILGEDQDQDQEETATVVSTSSLQIGKAERGNNKKIKKRKADKPPPGVNHGGAEKRMKGEERKEAAATMTATTVENSRVLEGSQHMASSRMEVSAGESSKENSKTKPDYIHVRARRGQATDSHSLAERVRRERISERMKYLQGLVPGCNKITGKAGMLDEIINYVQSLQRQVEFLSMKLATVNPRLGFNMDNFFSKELDLACNSGISTVGISSELIDASYLQFNPLQQPAVNLSELALCRTMNTVVSVPGTFSDALTLNVHRPSSSSACEADLQSLYGLQFHQGRESTFPFQSLQGNLLPNNLKMEM